jgi:AcrR family transcriptional regulator
LSDQPKSPGVEDPRPSLPPTAARILTAAQHVLVTKGFGGLTLKAIAEESGENSAMVQYYFGNKAGLVKAMIDSAFRDDQEDVAAVMSSVTGDDLLPKFVEGLRTISASESFRAFFEILPYALRDERFKTRLAEVIDWYRQIKLEWLQVEDREAPVSPDALLGFAELMLAVVDGLAIQKAVDDDFDLSRPYAALESILRRGLPDLLGSDLGAATLTK